MQILFYKLSMADASELHKLIAIVENASHSQIFSSSCLAITILVDIWKQIVQTAETRSIEFSSTSLPLQLVVLIMYRVTLQVSEVQDLFNVLHLLVRKSSDMRLLVLDKVVDLTVGIRKTDMLLGVIDYKGKRGVVVRSEILASIHKFLNVFLKNLECDDDSVLSQVYEKVKRIVETVRSCSFVDCHTQLIYSLLLHSPVLWCSNQIESDDIVNHGIVSLEYSNQMLTEREYWPVYRGGVYAARLGAWVTSALIFDKLKNNVRSNTNRFWLKSLSYLSDAEGKFQLLLMPRLGNWLRSSCCLPELSKDGSGDLSHCVALHEAYMNLQSSLGMLGSNISSSKLFRFQIWFLVLKIRLLETVIDLVERFELLNQDIRNKKISTGSDSLQEQLPRISIQLQKLAKEFDMLMTCFIDIDDDSSSIIATFALSCSVLAFITGIFLFLPGFEALVPFSSHSGVSVQDLVRRLWILDPEICGKLNILVKENESLTCFNVQPRNQVLRVCGKVKMLLSICRDALSCIYELQNQSHEEEIVSEITKSCKNLLSEAIMKWMQIPFGIPKYFFNIRYYPKYLWGWYFGYFGLVRFFGF